MSAGVPATDVHTHLAPVLSDEAQVATGVTVTDDRYTVGEHTVGPAALYRADRLDAWLGEIGLDQAWVSVPPPFFCQGQGERATAVWVEALNDGLVARTEEFTRLQVLGYLPLDQPEVAITEADRLLSRRQVVGFVGAAGGGSLPLDAEALEPLWERLDAAAAAVLLHPGATPDPRFAEHYLGNLLGNPVETGLAAAQLVFGDVVGRYQNVRFVLVHCGGVVPAVAGRWQRGVDTRRPGLGDLSLAPADAVRRLYADTLGHDPRMVDLAMETFGADRVVLGSDWPFPMGVDDPWTSVKHLPEPVRQAVARDNAAALLRPSESEHE